MAEKNSKTRLVFAALMMAFFTILSRIAGLAREVVRAHYLGTSMIADAFTIAFMIPNLFRRLVGEGAMTAAAVPVMMDEMKSGGVARLNEVVNAFFTLFTFILTGLCLIFILGASLWVEGIFARGFADDAVKMALTVELTQYMFFYLLFIGLAAVLQSVLNSFKIFGPSSFTPILLNLAIILCAMLLSDYFSSPVYAFVIGVMIGGFLQLVFQVPYVRKAGVTLKPSFKWRDPAVVKILHLMLPGLVGAGIYQVNVLVSQMISTYLEEGAVSSLQFSARLMEFTLGVFVVTISTAILPTLAGQVRDGETQAYRKTLEFSMGLVAIITIPSTIALIAIRYPLINLLFRTGAFDENSVDLTAWAFLFHTLGLYFIGIGRILVPAFYSKKDMTTPVKAAAVSMIVNLLFCVLLFRPLANGGIALANTLSALAQSAFLFVFVSRMIGELDLRRLSISVIKITVASLIAGAVCVIGMRAFDFEHCIARPVLIPGLTIIGIAFCLVFLGAAVLLRCPEINDLLRMARRKRNS